MSNEISNEEPSTTGIVHSDGAGNAETDQARPASTPQEHGFTLRYLSSVSVGESYQQDIEPAVAPGPELVRDVMVTAVVVAHEGALFKEIVDALIRNRVSAVPVIDAQRRVLGVVSEADLLLRVSRAHLAMPRGHHLSGRGEERGKLHAATARELMTSPAVVISPRAGIADAAWQAAHARVRRLPVVTDDGVLVGIVTRSDLLRTFLRDDEQIREDILQNLLIGAFDMDPSRIVVAVDEGVVTLSGKLERSSVAVAIVDAVSGVSGVVDVVDALTYAVGDAPLPAAAAVVY